MRASEPIEPTNPTQPANNVQQLIEVLLINLFNLMQASAEVHCQVHTAYLGTMMYRY